MRTCNTCGKTKPLDEFYIRKSRGKEYYQLRCKNCTKKIHNTPKRFGYINEGKKRNPEKAKEYHHRAYIRRKESGKVRETRLRAVYGINEQQYQSMLENQDNKCYFCGIEAEEYMEAKGKHLAVDHDHVTGGIRGLLCHRCNFRMAFVDTHESRIAEYKSITPLHYVPMQ